MLVETEPQLNFFSGFRIAISSQTVLYISHIENKSVKTVFLRGYKLIGLIEKTGHFQLAL